MGEVDNGLTLEGLAQRLGALERENARLRDEVAAVRGSDTGRDRVVGVLSTPSASRAENGAEDGGDQATQVPEERMNRRRLLKGAATAAAGLVVAGALTQRDIREAEAAQIIGTSVDGGQGGVNGFNPNERGYGVFGFGDFGEGVHGTGGRTGVFGEGNRSVSGTTGVIGVGATGVYGRADGGLTSGVGVQGDGRGTGPGVIGKNYSSDATGQSVGVGVSGQGNHVGVLGSTTDGNAVEGQVIGAGNGVVGSTMDGNAVMGRVTGEGNGVLGQVSGIGSGVFGRSTKGYGGHFQGVKAQLMLKPAARAGKPGLLTQHTQGEIFMDSASNLFVCVASSTDEAAAEWRKVNTTAV